MSLKSGLFAVIAALGLVALFFWFEPAPAPKVPLAAASAISPMPRTIELRIQAGRLVAGPEVIHAQQGDELILHVLSDSADEVHVHGYNLMLELAPNKLGTLQFTADRSGRFEYELEKTGVALGALEVLPRP